MTILNVDLDNTLIYSYKHDIGTDKTAVELYQGREISFMTETTCGRLKKIKENALIVPTTTRSIEQYNRINLRIGPLEYALVCNGGVLLVNGRKDVSWYEESAAMIQESMPELEKASRFLAKDSRRTFELRWIEGLFLFTKCSPPEEVVKELRSRLNPHTADVFHNKEKVYVVPKNLNKGNAVQRFQKWIHGEQVIAAGDSEFDIPMLRAADVGIAPHGFKENYQIPFPVEEMAGSQLFSEEMTGKVLEILKEKSIESLSNKNYKIVSKQKQPQCRGETRIGGTEI